jgi:hypothetical protein
MRKETGVFNCLKAASCLQADVVHQVSGVVDDFGSTLRVPRNVFTIVEQLAKTIVVNSMSASLAAQTAEATHPANPSPPKKATVFAVLAWQLIPVAGGQVTRTTASRGLPNMARRRSTFILPLHSLLARLPEWSHGAGT